MTVLPAVAAAGAVGAPARYLVDAYVQQRARGVFPWGTFAVNISGSLLLGLIAGLGLYQGLGSTPKAIVGAGFCGAYTTFSTFSYETVRLIEDGSLFEAGVNAGASLVVGLAAAAAGLALAAAL